MNENSENDTNDSTTVKILATDGLHVLKALRLFDCLGKIEKIRIQKNLFFGRYRVYVITFKDENAT
jgi:hypothetical protein